MTLGTKLFLHYNKCLCWFKFGTRNSHCTAQGMVGVNKLNREILIEIAPFHGYTESSKKSNLEKFPI